MRLHTSCSYFINVIIIVQRHYTVSQKGKSASDLQNAGSFRYKYDPYFLSLSLSDVSKSQKIVFRVWGLAVPNTPKSGPQWSQYTRADNFAKCRSIVKTRWLYCMECPQYSIRLEALGHLCDCLSGRVQVLKVIWQKADRRRRRMVQWGHIGDTWRIRLNLCILRPTGVHNPNGKPIGIPSYKVGIPTLKVRIPS